MHIWNIALSVVRQEEEEESTFLGTPFHRPGLAPEELFSIGPVHVTNSMVTTLLVVLVVSLLAIWLTRRMQLIPGGKQNFLEVVVEGLLGLVEGAAGRRVGRIILPLIGTLFVYILVANWFALLPGIGTIIYHGEHDVPLLRAPNSDYNMTLAMAFLTMVIVQVAGFAAHGFGHLKEYFPKVGRIYLVNPLNIIDEFARLLSLSVRLFANVFAGEVLVGVMLALSFVAVFAVIPVVVPAIFLALEVFFGAIQALVFALLSLIYISLAVGGHSEGHDAEHDDDRAAALTQEGAARS
ncbi:MAG: F0F1 ATP synthase subunit A [Chloroflexia bacterium]|nr:F0F1 ATP synthase subunit A [Chloroflexia bacterium]